MKLIQVDGDKAVVLGVDGLAPLYRDSIEAILETIVLALITSGAGFSYGVGAGAKQWSNRCRPGSVLGDRGRGGTVLES